MRIYIFLTTIIVLITCGFGCSDSELDKAKSELEAVNQRIKEINLLLQEKELLIEEKNEDLVIVKAENIRLSAENSKLEDDFNDLKIEFNGLSTRYVELDIWSKKLADGYGTGIWYMGESDRPVFIKSMKQSDIMGVVQELNKRFQKDNLPGIILNKIADKTAYVGTDNDELLTQRKGSFGARSYIRAVTYTITSIKDIDCIWLEIKEGDHAVPGEYCR